MTIIFFEQKYAALTLATKIFKNQEYHLFLPKGMQHTALVGKTIWLEAGRLQRSLVDARKRAIRLEVRGGGITAGIAARTEPSDGEYEKHLRAEPQDWTGGGRQVPQ